MDGSSVFSSCAIGSVIFVAAFASSLWLVTRSLYTMLMDSRKQVKVVMNEAARLSTEVDALKDDLQRASAGRLYQRVGGSIYAKVFVDRDGEIMITDNLFCRMIADGNLNSPRSTQFLPDSIKGLVIIKYGLKNLDKISHFMVRKNTSTPSSLRMSDAEKYIVILQSTSPPASLEIGVVVRTGAPNDYNV